MAYLSKAYCNCSPVWLAENIQDVPTGWGNLSGYPNWLEGIIQDASTDWGILSGYPNWLEGNIQVAPTDWGKFGKLS
jgi:hypothetical protein